MDCYNILGVDRECSNADIKKAYRKLAMKYHPDKNPGDEAAKMFQDISEAYLILSDNKTRALYDQFGYEGMKERVEDSEDLTKQSPDDVFKEFFGTKNPFANFSFGDTEDDNDLNKKGSHDNKHNKKPAEIIQSLPCTLKELYNGCIKKIQITKKQQSTEGGEIQEINKILSITVKPGWKKGTRIVFPNEGDVMYGTLAPDIVFIIDEVNDEKNSGGAFTRFGDHLIYVHQVSLADALVGGSISVHTLDNRILSIACPEIVFPTYEKVIEGEGMPISRSIDKEKNKGNLIIRFDIQFPQYLTIQQRQQIKTILKTSSSSSTTTPSSTASSSTATSAAL